MRIVAGRHRGRPLASPKGLQTRPTSDRARESVFNILQHAPWAENVLEDAAVMDVFCGTGALGLEALSRGAAHAVFIDKDKAALNACRQNIATFKEEKNSLVLQQDALSCPQRPPHIAPRNLVFLDPPYGYDLGIKALRHLEAQNWLAPHVITIMEMKKSAPEPLPDSFTLVNERHYGIALLRFLKKHTK
ncbi:MAG: 16S rRNA (guanine(966)-N(2))-methyltransferase RsmD [Alphaproteobacteria bacterium]|nr:16S rRNA (guanine(966)-N(2))-methyltransferase RsmD [Alphaproteobacteria bacterium]